MSSPAAIIEHSSERHNMASSSSSSSTTFLDFPVEILRLVFHSFSPNDFHSVCLVCKALRALAEPLLYSRIHWTWKTPRTPPITLILRSFLHNPRLAGYIRSLVLDGYGFPGLERHHFRAPKIYVARAELDELTTYVDSLRVHYGDLWIRELQAGTMDAFVAALLSQLSNLTYLRLGPNFAKETQLVGLVLGSALCESRDYGLPTYQYLQDVSIDYYVNYDRNKILRNTRDILPFFYLPNVRCISASIDNPVLFAWPVKHVPTNSALKSLDLTFIREDHLRQILSATTGLKTLRWQWYYSENLADPFVKPIIDLEKIVEAMFHVGDTLTDLTISAMTDISQGPFPPTLTIEGSMNGIVNFKALKRFEAPWPFFLGFSPVMVGLLKDVIPRNIEFLTITDDLWLQEENLMEDSTLLGAIRSWLEDSRASTPHLCGIHLLLKEMDDQWGPTMREKLRELCAGAGVQLEITKLAADVECC